MLHVIVLDGFRFVTIHCIGFSIITISLSLSHSSHLYSVFIIINNRTISFKLHFIPVVSEFGYRQLWCPELRSETWSTLLNQILFSTFLCFITISYPIGVPLLSANVISLLSLSNLSKYLHHSTCDILSPNLEAKRYFHIVAALYVSVTVVLHLTLMYTFICECTLIYFHHTLIYCPHRSFPSSLSTMSSSSCVARIITAGIKKVFVHLVFLQ